MLLVSICEECYKKIVARARIPSPCQDPGTPIKEYLKTFQIYLVKNTVCYLSSIEDFKNVIFGKGGIEPMDV